MQLLSSTELSLVRTETSENVGPTSEICRNGRPAGRRVPGAVLEAAALWRDRLLLLTTDDIPYEDVLHILLLDSSLKLLDQARLGGIYSTGRFALLPSPEPDRLRFRFIGDTDWTVRMLDAPGWYLPFWSEPTGVTRPWGLTRHFEVCGQPQP